MKPATREELLSDDDGPDYIQIMQAELKKAQKVLLANPKYTAARNQDHVERMTALAKFKEDKIYTMFTADSPTYFKTQWSYLERLYPVYKKQIKVLTKARFNAVYKDLRGGSLKIQERPPLVPYSYQESEKHERMNLLKEQSEDLRMKIQQINKTLDSAELDHEQNQKAGEKDMLANLYSEEKKKQIQEWLQKKKQQKQERRKRMEEQRAKAQQEYAKIQKERKQIEENRQKALKEQFISKQMQLRKKRDQEKALREQRNSEYIRVKKQFKEKPRLFQKLLKSYSERRQYEDLEKRHRMLSEKKERYLHIDELKIEQHEKQYELRKKMKEEERQNRFERFLSEQQKSRVRYHSSFELDQKKADQSILEKEQAREKANKIRQYQMIVKERFQPKVDEDKRKQMMTLIEEAELNSRKKLKKTVLEDGKIVYQEIKTVDPREIGMQYLEMTKQMAARAKQMRGTSMDKDESPLPPQKKNIDYLKELRDNPRAKPGRMEFIGRNNLSFEQKMQKVMMESQKLNENAKQNELRLKFGKFKTSDQILTCKEEIDQNYIDVAFMKLRMIKDASNDP